MKKIVYLFGTGLVQSEISSSGWPGSTIMTKISKDVYTKSKTNNGKYYNLVKDLSNSPEDFDIEHMLSLFEEIDEPQISEFGDLIDEVRILFQKSIIENLKNSTNVYVKPKFLAILLKLHKDYSNNLGDDGEILEGVITVNFDNLIEKAYIDVYGGLNYGIDLNYNNIPKSNAPYIMKLHGSFNWKLDGTQIKAFPEFEESVDENSFWLRPSVFKRPEEEIYKKLWKKSKQILENCDILRIVGCSLRIEDWFLISLIFRSQLGKKFTIELILSENTGSKIKEKLPFLSKMKSIKDMYNIRDFNQNNSFKSFVLDKYNKAVEKNPNIRSDTIINNTIGD